MARNHRQITNERALAEETNRSDKGPQPNSALILVHASPVTLFALRRLLRRGLHRLQGARNALKVTDRCPCFKIPLLKVSKNGDLLTGLCCQLLQREACLLATSLQCGQRTSDGDEFGLLGNRRPSLIHLL